MKVAHALLASAALHIAAILLATGLAARSDASRQAMPPVSVIQAQLFTYQKGFVPNVPELVEATPPAAELVAVNAAVVVSDGGVRAPRSDPSAKDVKDVQEPQSAKTPPVPVVVAASESVVDSARLDTSPAVISEVMLEYPLAANNREGTVTLAITIGGDGKVEDIRVLKAVPAGYFEAAAIAGFKAARFSPGMLGGLGVKSRMEVEVEFMPTNRGGAVAGQR